MKGLFDILKILENDYRFFKPFSFKNGAGFFYNCGSFSVKTQREVLV